MKLVVIIPALNEEKTVGGVISRIPATIDGIDEIEVAVVDDGSTDGTIHCAREAGASVVSHDANLGLGAALASGMDYALRAGAEVIVNMDADGQFNSEDIPALIAPILKDGYGFVTCTRFGRRDFRPKMPRMKLWGNLIMTKLISRVIWKQHFTDVSCGFRAYSRETALRLNLFGRFSYTQEMFIDLATKNVRMTEVPLRVRGEREFGNSRIAGNLFNYGMRVGTIIIRAVRDSRPLRFFGGIGLITLLMGLAQGMFVFVVWLSTGRTSPYQSLIVGSATFLMLGFLLCIMALLADMLGRQRKIIEDIRYLLRKQEYDSKTFAPPGTADVLFQTERTASEAAREKESVRKP